MGETTMFSRTRLPLLSVAIILLLAVSGVAEEQLQGPPYQEGEFWHFEVRHPRVSQIYDSTKLVDGVHKIVYSQNQFKTSYLSPDGKEELGPPSPALMLLLGRGKDFSFPLTVGKKWSYRYPHLIITPPPRVAVFRWRIVDFNVAASERVKTKVGTFQAFKLVKANRLMTGTRRPWVTTYYYSPQTRSVVKMSSSEEEGGRVEIALIKHGIATAVASTPKLDAVGVVTAPVTLTEAATNEPQNIVRPADSTPKTGSAVISQPPADRLELFIGGEETSVYFDNVRDPQPAVKTEDASPPLPAKPQATASSAIANQELALLTKPTTSVNAESFQLKMNIIGQRKEPDGNYIEVFVNESSVLRSRDNFQIHLESSRPAYIYILIYDSESRASQLFPDPKIDQPGFVEAGKKVEVPGDNQWFWLDDSTGTETIYVLASERPMIDIRDLLSKMQTADDRAQQRTSDEIKERITIMQRGVGGITKGQAVTYTLSDGKKIQKVTDVVTGTGSVVRAVSFQHR
jgi:hypothetical protein